MGFDFKIGFPTPSKPGEEFFPFGVIENATITCDESKREASGIGQKRTFYHITISLPSGSSSVWRSSADMTDFDSYIRSKNPDLNIPLSVPSHKRFVSNDVQKVAKEKRMKNYLDCILTIPELHPYLVRLLEIDSTTLLPDIASISVKPRPRTRHKRSKSEAIFISGGSLVIDDLAEQRDHIEKQCEQYRNNRLQFAILNEQPRTDPGPDRGSPRVPPRGASTPPPTPKTPLVVDDDSWDQIQTRQKSKSNENASAKVYVLSSSQKPPLPPKPVDTLPLPVIPRGKKSPRHKYNSKTMPLPKKRGRKTGSGEHEAVRGRSISQAAFQPPLPQKPPPSAPRNSQRHLESSPPPNNLHRRAAPPPKPSEVQKQINFLPQPCLVKSHSDPKPPHAPRRSTLPLVTAAQPNPDLPPFRRPPPLPHSLQAKPPHPRRKSPPSSQPKSRPHRLPPPPPTQSQADVVSTTTSTSVRRPPPPPQKVGADSIPNAGLKPKLPIHRMRGATVGNLPSHQQNDTKKARPKTLPRPSKNAAQYSKKPAIGPREYRLDNENIFEIPEEETLQKHNVKAPKSLGAKPSRLPAPRPNKAKGGPPGPAPPPHPPPEQKRRSRGHHRSASALPCDELVAQLLLKAHLATPIVHFDVYSLHDVQKLVDEIKHCESQVENNMSCGGQQQINVNVMGRKLTELKAQKKELVISKIDVELKKLENEKQGLVEQWEFEELIRHREKVEHLQKQRNMEEHA